MLTETDSSTVQILHHCQQKQTSIRSKKQAPHECGAPPAEIPHIARTAHAKTETSSAKASHLLHTEIKKLYAGIAYSRASSKSTPKG